jgi:hypothetical protein
MADDDFLEINGPVYAYEWDLRRSPSPVIVVEDIIVDPNPRNPRRQRVGGAVRRPGIDVNQLIDIPPEWLEPVDIVNLRLPEDHPIVPDADALDEDDEDGAQAPAESPSTATARAQRALQGWFDSREGLVVKHIQFSPFLRSREHVSEQLAILASMPQAVIQRLKDRDMQCNCGMLGVLLEERSQRVLYVTEVSRFYLQLPVWQCADITCPFHQGFTLSPQQLDCLPASPSHLSPALWDDSVRSRRWYMSTLLEFIALWKYNSGSPPSFHSLAAVILQIHNYRGCSAPLSDDILRKEISVVHREHGFLKMALKSLEYLLMKEENGMQQGVAACGACYQRPTGLHSLQVDANYKLTHFAHAARQSAGFVDEQWPNHVPKLFLSAEVHNTFEQMAEDMAAGANRPVGVDYSCSDFKAANEIISSSSDKLALRGVAVSTCDHGFINSAMDMKRGERYYYGVALLVLCVMRIWCKIKIFYYDINCRFAPYLFRFLNFASFTTWLGEELRPQGRDTGVFLGWLRGMLFPLPCLHTFNHSSTCRAKHSAHNMPGAGLQYVEHTETAFAELGRHGATTQYMNSFNRRFVLERAMAVLNERRAQELPKLLSSMHIKARQVRHESSRSWVLLFDMLVERGIAEERIRELVARRLAAEAIARAEGGNQAPPLPWQAQYAIYRLRQIYSTPDHFALPLPDAALICPGNAQHALKDRERRDMQRIEEDKFQGAPWNTMADEARLTNCIAHLAEVKVAGLKDLLLNLSQQYQFTESLHNALVGRRREQQQLRDSNNRLGGKIETLLGGLKGWLQGGYMGFERLRMKCPEMVNSLEIAPQLWRVENFKNGQYPWEAPAEEEEGEQGIDFIITKLVRHHHNIERSNEQLNIVELQMNSALSFYRDRMELIDTHLTNNFQALPQHLREDPEYCRGLEMILTDLRDEFRKLDEESRALFPVL